MPANVLVIVVDGLRASALGAYGNAAYATPALDRFAAESLLLDWCFAPSSELPDIYRALWSSSKSNQEASVGSLPRAFAEAGYATTLVTDDSALHEYAGASDFEELVQVENSSKSTSDGKRSESALETVLASVFYAAASQAAVVRSDKLQLLWLHARGMYGLWDAPLELQLPLLDENDPEPMQSSAPPDISVNAASDPDLAFRCGCAYAAQIMVLDESFENLLAAIGTNGGEWLVTLIGARGFPLGEHGRIGGVDSRLYAEQLQVPWLVRFPNKLGQLCRADVLTSHYDLLPTLLDSIRGKQGTDPSRTHGMSVMPLASSPRTPWREATVSKSPSARSIRTQAWCLREGTPLLGDNLPSNELASTPELYVRPDDRWEANDVAKLCPDVVEELNCALHDASGVDGAVFPEKQSAS